MAKIPQPSRNSILSTYCLRNTLIISRLMLLTIQNLNNMVDLNHIESLMKENSLLRLEKIELENKRRTELNKSTRANLDRHTNN
jgi:hypothetical protein